MHQKSAVACQYQAVHNAQNGIDRIRVSRLANPALSRSWIPLGIEIATPQYPLSRLYLDLKIFVSRSTVRPHIHIKFEFWPSRAAHEAGVTVLQQVAKGCVLRAQQDGDATDLNSDFVSLDGWAQFIPFVFAGIPRTLRAPAQLRRSIPLLFH